MSNRTKILPSWLRCLCIALSVHALAIGVQTAGAAEATVPALAQAGGAAGGSSNYRIDTGDRISVTVYQEPDLSVQGVRVKANGTIALPLLGDLEVAGLTSGELHDLIVERLLDGYLKKPSIAVSIDGYRLYYIKGEVNRPGGYSFVDGLTVAKAVALAGGYTVRASESSISLVRESDPDNPVESVGPNTAIAPGDIITVGESIF